jgi:hypothetical protein
MARALLQPSPARRKADRMDCPPEERHCSHAEPLDALVSLRRLMQRLEHCAAAWQVEPGCEMQVDLRHAIGPSTWPSGYWH